MSSIIMSEPRLTEERLKSWLDANQVTRERLCCALLPLLGDYTDVSPRRPKGGPDGARDLQARLGSMEVWAGIGFQNGTNDSQQNKRWVEKKFRDDLDNALGENPSLRAFVFFTNVDLTPGELESLRNYATGKGIEHVNVFWRERLRVVLDSPPGFGYRLQYLRIAMSEAEQISFFDRFGAKLEAQIRTHHAESMRSMKRIEFQTDKTRKLSRIELLVGFTQPVTADQLGHFRIACRLQKFHDAGRKSIVFVGMRDAYPLWHNGGKTQRVHGQRRLVWIPGGADASPFDYQTNRLLVQSVEADGRTPDPDLGARLEDLDGVMIDFFMTEPVVEHLQSIAVILEDYVFLSMHHGNVVTSTQIGVTHDLGPDIAWPEVLSAEEAAIPWVSLHIPEPGVDPFRQDILPAKRIRSPFVRFAENTPIRKQDYVQMYSIPVARR